jgi:hypothetical protein
MNDILDEIKRRGKSNAEAIKTHHDFQAGIRGAFGRNKTKSEIRGLACPHPPQARRSSVSLRLPNIKIEGRPLKCNRKDGYERNPTTGQIRRCVAEK